MIRGLHALWDIKPRGTAPSQLIEAFLNVQVRASISPSGETVLKCGWKHNSLINNAKAPNMDWYSPDWRGPPPDKPMPWGQVTAIDLLNSVFNSNPAELG